MTRDRPSVRNSATGANGTLCGERMTAKPAIVVTGGAGYIGSHVQFTLRDAGWPVVVVDNLSTGVAESVPKDVELVVADCGDAARMRTLFTEREVGAVMHFAASVRVSESVADPMKYYLNNAANTADLIDCCIKSGVETFIYSSTAAVYGEPDVAFVTEKHSPRPVSPYGKSKLMGERMLEDAANAHPFRYAVLRYFNAAGADPAGRIGQTTPNATHLVKVACETAVGKRPFMEVFGTDYDTPDGTCVRDYVHVSDLAYAHIAALEYLLSGADSIVVNCGYGCGHSVLDVLAAARRVSGAAIDARVAAKRQGDVARLVCDSRRIRERFGWIPKHDDLATIVRTAHDWEGRLHDGTAFENLR